MPRAISTIATTLVATVAMPTLAAAQLQPWVALDATIGTARGVGDGERYGERQLPTAEVLLAVRLRRASGHAPVIGVGRGWAGISGDYACVGGAPCPVPFPLLRYRAVHLGWEYRSRRGATLRALAGAAWDAHTFHVEGVRRGWQGRVDVATSAFGPVAAVAHDHGLRAPSGPPGTGMWGAGLGIRVR